MRFLVWSEEVLRSAGPVNLASNQGTQPTTIIDTQNNNYFSTDETLQHQIVEPQQLITELETQHPNLKTEAQATQIVQQTMDPIQAQTPDRWQKLCDQIAILEQQFFNPRSPHPSPKSQTGRKLTRQSDWFDTLSTVN